MSRRGAHDGNGSVWKSSTRSAVAILFMNTPTKLAKSASPGEIEPLAPVERVTHCCTFLSVSALTGFTSTFTAR